MDNNVLSVSSDAGADVLSKVFTLSSSNPWATKWAFETGPWLFSVMEQTHGMDFFTLKQR